MTAEWKADNNFKHVYNLQAMAEYVARKMEQDVPGIRADHHWSSGPNPKVGMAMELNPDNLLIYVRVRPARRCVPMYGLAVRISREEIEDAEGGMYACLDLAAAYLGTNPWGIYRETDPEFPTVSLGVD